MINEEDLKIYLSEYFEEIHVNITEDQIKSIIELAQLSDHDGINHEFYKSPTPKTIYHNIIQCNQCGYGGESNEAWYDYWVCPKCGSRRAILVHQYKTIKKVDE